MNSGIAIRCINQRWQQITMAAVGQVLTVFLVSVTPLSAFWGLLSLVIESARELSVGRRSDARLLEVMICPLNSLSFCHRKVRAQAKGSWLHCTMRFARKVMTVAHDLHSG